LPETASINQCNQWVNGYFESYPDKPITAVILYQPSIVSDIANNGLIHNCCQVIVRQKRYTRWIGLRNDLHFTIPIGVVSDKPASNSILIEKDGQEESFDILKRYTFQRGNIYLMSKLEADGSMSSHIGRLASGVFTHSVFRAVPGEQAYILSGHFAPEDKLLIL
jgi:hypothetical protein